MNFQMVKLVFEKAEEPEIKLPTSAGSLKKQEFQKNIYFYFIDYAKAFDCVDHNKLWTILKEMGIPDTTWPASWETCMQVRKQLPGAKVDQVFSPMAFLRVGSRVLAPGKQQLELDMEQQTGSK